MIVCGAVWGFGLPAAAHDFGDAYPFGTEADIPTTPVIVLDTSAAPDMAGFAYRAKARCEAHYARIAHFLYSDGFMPPSRFRFVFTDADGPVAGDGNLIAFDARLYRKRPQDHGAAVRAMVKAIQKYPRPDPEWLVEGIADYIRYYMAEPAAQRPALDPDGAHYTDGGPATAGFLDWVTRTRDAAFVPSVNAALREDRYTTSFWRERTRKDLDALWTEFLAAVRTGWK